MRDALSIVVDARLCQLHTLANVDTFSCRVHLKSPFDVAVEPNGNILVVDPVGDKLIRIDHSMHVQTVLAQDGLLADIRSVEVFGGG